MREHIIGVSVSDTTAEMTMVTASVTAMTNIPDCGWRNAATTMPTAMPPSR